jgi:hypothetical protein
VADVENIMIDGAVVAFAARTYLCAATPADLQVPRLAATLEVSRGELRPQDGWGSFQHQTPKSPIVKRASLRSGFGATSIDMGSARNFKPRNGSHAISGTG